MIIDDTYFIREISIPTDNDNYLNKLNSQIEWVEKRYLEKALGYELYSLFNAELPTPTTQRYIDILDGVEYTSDTTGRLEKWNGLKNTNKDSFLAYFTYYYYLENAKTSASGQGTTSNQFQNSEKISPNFKQVLAYNLAVEGYNKLYDFMLTNEAVYPEWNWTQIKRINSFNL